MGRPEILKALSPSTYDTAGCYMSRTHSWIHKAHLNMLRHIKPVITRFQSACEAGLVPDVPIPTVKRPFELAHAGRRKILDFVEGK